MRQDHAQLGFEALLAHADQTNRQREFERETAHLPAAMDEGIAFYRVLIRQHHAAMLAADVEKALALRKEADRLALKLNGGNSGILAHDNAPGYVLARRTAAAPGAVPLWGQTGDFVIEVSGMKVRIELDGMFGIGSGFCYWPGFAAHAVEYDRPFLSGTGYRSFLGIHAEPEPDLTPDTFAAKIIAAYVGRELKGRLEQIAPRYRNPEGGP